MTSIWRTVHSPTGLGSRASPRSIRLLALVAASGLFAAGPLLAAPASGASWGSAPASWSNGVVECVFAPDHPSVMVSPLGHANSGMGLGMGEIDEIDSSGHSVATATMSVGNWSVQNLSDSARLSLGYAQRIPVHPSLPSSGIPASVEVFVNISTPYEAAASPSDNASTVSMYVTIVGWPGAGGQDQLSLVLPLWPATGRTEHLAQPPGVPAQVDSVSNESGSTQEFFVAGAAASGWSSSAGTTSVPAQARDVVSADRATVTVGFGPGSAHLTSLSYVARVGVILPAKVLGIPLYEYAVAAGAAGLVSVLAAVGLRHARRRPSQLTYVED